MKNSKIATTKINITRDLARSSWLLMLPCSTHPRWSPPKYANSREHRITGKVVSSVLPNEGCDDEEEEEEDATVVVVGNRMNCEGKLFR